MEENRIGEKEGKGFKWENGPLIRLVILVSTFKFVNKGLGKRFNWKRAGGDAKMCTFQQSVKANLVFCLLCFALPSK